MTKHLLLVLFVCLGFISSQAQVNLLRGSVEVYTGPSGSTTPTTNYIVGFGPGTPLNNALIGFLNPTDVISITDPYAITSESGGCTVNELRLTIRIKPVAQASPLNALSIQLSQEEVCGGTNWRFASPACSTGDRELGDPNSITTFGVANLENLGLIELKLTFEFISVSGGCTIPAPIVVTCFFEVGNAPLPIELTGFGVSPEGRSNRIDWTVAEEVDLDRYVVERATTPDGFSALSEVAPRGAGNGIEAVYSTIDPNPAAITYYRLRSVDLDGAEQFSDVVVVRRDDIYGGGIKVYPNPAQGIAHIEMDAELGAEQIIVIDATGRVVHTQRLTGSRSAERLDLSGMPTGVYTVSVTGAADSYSTRLVLE